MKKILNISSMVILIAGMIVLLAFTDQEHQQTRYSDFHAEVMNPSDEDCITEPEIRDLVFDHFGEIKGAPISHIDLFRLEQLVLASPYISSCEAFQTIDGNLELKARVRKPLVRVINDDNQQYYLDYQGCAMPVNPVHPAHVPVASGFISDRYVSIEKSEQSLKTFPPESVLHQIYPVAYHISADEFLASFIDQIYINDSLEIELVPKIGSQVILFGNGENAKEKLENLRTFYEKVMSKIDWTLYTSINLKYKNQVVCSKYKRNEQE